MKLKTLLIDMDAILVNMIPTWFKEYNLRTGEKLSLEEVTDWNLQNVKYPQVLGGIIEEPNFFYNLPPMNNAVKYFTKLLEENFDMIILTQPPRKANYAVEDKKNWMRLYFPNFDVSNMIFAHRKQLVRGDLMFDDKPAHLVEWKNNNPDKITATIKYSYNINCSADVFFNNKNTAWREFYEYIKEYS